MKQAILNMSLLALRSNLLTKTRRLLRREVRHRRKEMWEVMYLQTLESWTK